MLCGSCQAFRAACLLQITQPPKPMDFSLILSNILTPPILFFFLGVLACLFRSNLEIPQPLPKFFPSTSFFPLALREAPNCIKAVSQWRSLRLSAPVFSWHSLFRGGPSLCSGESSTFQTLPRLPAPMDPCRQSPSSPLLLSSLNSTFPLADT